MQIGIIGYYQGNNHGDARILHCLRQIFAGHELVVVGSYEETSTRIDELNACDFVLFGGGGLVCPGRGHAASIFAALKTRFGCVGLGIECRDQSNEELIAVIEDKAEFMWVRDKASAALLHRPAILGSDATFLDPYPVVTPIAEDVCGVNIRNWPFVVWDSENYKKLMRSSFNDRLVALLFTTPTFHPHIPENDEPFFARLAIIYDSSKSLPELYRQCRYIVGMRFHSIVFAIQSGLPFVSLAYWPKCRNLCVDGGFADMVLELDEVARLPEKIQALRNNYDELRKRTLAYREKSIVAATTAAATVKNLMGI